MTGPNPFKEVIKVFGQVADATAESCGYTLTPVERTLHIHNMFVCYMAKQASNAPANTSPFDMVQWPEEVPK